MIRLVSNANVIPLVRGVILVQHLLFKLFETLEFEVDNSDVDIETFDFKCAVL